VAAVHERRRYANENQALGCIKGLQWSEARFWPAEGDGRYGDLEELAKCGMIDRPRLEGYGLVLGVSNPQGAGCFHSDADGCRGHWWACAYPLVPGETGSRVFFSSERGFLAYRVMSPGESTAIVFSRDAYMPEGFTPFGGK
jgi:hypothetical protein